jgi:hypothetical protein
MKNLARLFSVSGIAIVLTAGAAQAQPAAARSDCDTVYGYSGKKGRDLHPQACEAPQPDRSNLDKWNLLPPSAELAAARRKDSAGEPMPAREADAKPQREGETETK